jgi:hypothetical protein
MMNYINAWKMIRPDYMKLFKWKNMYDIEITMLAIIGVNNTAIQKSTGVIKTGNFTITNPKASGIVEPNALLSTNWSCNTIFVVV